MNWDGAIERNREVLKRILASLVAMAGLPVLRAGDAGIAGADVASPFWMSAPHKGEGNQVVAISTS